VTVALHGNLKDFGIAEVFQLIGQQRKTGLLEIAGESQRVRLAFEEGAVVWAVPVGKSEFAVLGDRLVRCGLITRAMLDEMTRESDSSARPLPALLVANSVVAESDLEEISELLSRETIFEVMRWSGGSFHFTAQTIHHNVAPEKLLAAEQILMDGLRMLDEWRTFEDLVPSDDSVFRRVGRLDVYRQQRGEGRHNSEQVDRIYQLVDGRLTIRRVIDLSRLGTFEATRILAELHQAKLIEPLDVESTRQLRQRKKRAMPVAQYVRLGLAAVAPIALLAMVVLLGLKERPLGAELEGPAFARRPLQEVRQQFERYRLHNALEARRYVLGTWPDDLSSEDALAPFDEFAMAHDPARPYYYAKHGNGILLLAPKR
jgi:hypothetical protein